MAIFGYDRTNFLGELDDPLDTQEGVLTPAAQRVRVLRNVLGDDNIALADVLATDVATAGDVENDKFIKAGVSGEATAIVDFSNLTLAAGARLLRGVNDFEAVSGWIAFSGNTEQDAFRYSAYFQPQTSASGKLLGIGNTAILQSGASVNVAEAAQLHIIVQSGATITDRAADSTAGIHPIWAKVQGDVGSTWNAGVRVAPIWADYKINGSDLSGEESYMLLLSAGSNIHSIFRYEGGGNATYLLETDEGIGNGFMAATGYKATNTNSQVGNFVVNLNGTLYGIPLMAVS